jgi:cell division septal protein FtsQ
MIKSRVFLGLAAIILVLSGGYIFACHSSLFLVEEIKITGNDRIPADEITEKLKACLDRNIFRLDLDEVEGKLREDERIRKLKAERRLPGCIVVEVEEKTPLLWVNLAARGSRHKNLGLYGLSVDQEIVPLSRNDLSEDLPIVSGIELEKGKSKSSPIPEPYRRWSNPKAERALEFYCCVAQIDPTSSDLIAEIHVDDQLCVTLYLLPGIKVVMGHDDFEKKWTRVKTVLAGEERVGEIRCLDLRFDDQVVLARSTRGSGSGRP